MKDRGLENISGKSRPASYQHCRHDGGSMGTNCLTSRSMTLRDRFDTPRKSSLATYRRKSDHFLTTWSNESGPVNRSIWIQVSKKAIIHLRSLQLFLRFPRYAMRLQSFFFFCQKSVD
jgi:hypothetical protein